LQFRPVLGQVATNLEIINKHLGRRRFDLAVLPELATTGYNFETRDDLKKVAETRRGKSFKFFKDLSVRAGGAIVWGMVEKDGDKIYNTAVLSTPEGQHKIYRKTHLFFREKVLFDSGNTGFKVFRWRNLRIGLMICFDWIFPEAARTLALKRSQIICHPSNLVMKYCQDAMITRSLENGVFAVTTNRIGREKNECADLTFTGRSQITSPDGSRILRFSRSEEAFKTVKLNPEIADTKTVNDYNDRMADRRPRLYRI